MPTNTALADPQNAEELAALRDQIDEIDAEMHRLLMRRGEVIDRLVAAKRTQASGVAFRPGREVDMLRRLASRHSGTLPLSTVEHVWREIIGTFTQAQASFKVHTPNATRPGTRDTLRFHFGFSAELVDHGSVGEAIAAAAASGTDLVVVPLDGDGAEPWWRPLAEPGAPIKVVTALPLLVPAGELGVAPALVLGSSGIEIDDAPFGVYAVAAPTDAAGIHPLCRAGDRSLVAYEDAGALRDSATGSALHDLLTNAAPVGRLYALPKL
ncbi:chorismate mutase [Lutibaculum baratangense]|uniref:chorismate mutase n=1 Tax=Lutibaculum baratangense AMV1 TaxID=631454 RepID=V4RK27_9HYPH|nr:chorismate mutase [Lutibaculum baratangense]ESR26396.1 Chorismate mutase I [Lutibaculum baratangense AMV1]